MTKIHIKYLYDKGFTEAVLIEYANDDDFHRTAEILENGLGYYFDKKIYDFDSVYWIFEVENSKFVLYYSKSWGVSIYPKSAKNSSDKENGLVKEISEKIKRSDDESGL
jgi:hypothetical protein